MMGTIIPAIPTNIIMSEIANKIISQIPIYSFPKNNAPQRHKGRKEKFEVTKMNFQKYEILCYHVSSLCSTK